MTIRVAELVSNLRQKSRVEKVRMGDVRLITDGDSAGMLRVGDDELFWGGTNTQRVMAFVKGPAYKYVDHEDLDWQATVLQHHIDRMADNQALWYIEGNNVSGVYHEDDKVLPLSRVAEQVADVFAPDDLANVLYSTDQVEINVTSEFHSVTVPGIPGFDSRPMAGSLERRGIQVGDISNGGVRIILQPGKPERAPIVEEFWERYVCTNGLTRRLAGSQVNLRGRTVDELLTEMNNIMRVIWEGLEGSGRAILHSANTPIPSSPSNFIREVALERNINAQTVLKLEERAATLPPNPTVYDITQIITAMANEDGLPVKTRRDLQSIGGDLTVDTQRMIHRCVQCAQPMRHAA